ncbi:MAG: glycosyltransferase [Acidobacteriota bacterium]
MDISVVIPTYNRASLLPKLLTAWGEVDKATKYKYELIFSDDGSSDDTIATLKQHANRLPIIILENQHGGAARARNAAIRIAQGEKTLMIGDDIFPNPQLVNRHVELSRQFGPDTAILGDIKWHPELKLNYLMTHITEVGHEQFSLNAFRPGQNVDFRHFYTSNISVDSQFLLSEEVLFDESFYIYGFEDAELGYRLSKRGLQIIFDPEAPGYHHHIYNVAGFCKRQRSAGDMAVVFVEAHPELENIFGIERTWKRYSAFRDSRLAGLPTLSDDGPDFDAVIRICETYEQELSVASEGERRFIKLALSSLYLRLFRLSFELGILTKLDPTRTDYEHYLRSVYFNPDGYWSLWLEATDAFKDLSEADRSLREIVLLSYADQTNAGMQIALANKEVELLRGREAQAQTERELVETREELDRIKASYAWRVGTTAVYPAKKIMNLAKKVTSGIPQRVASVGEEGAQKVAADAAGADNVAADASSPDHDGAISKTKLGIICSERNLPSKGERDDFLSEVGKQHCFILRKDNEKFQVDSSESELKYDSLPVDFIYEPDNWDQRLTNDHFRNALLCLAHVSLDFVIVSSTLSPLPQLAISSSARNHLIFSKRLGPDFLENGDKKAKGRVMRLLPPDFPVTEVGIEEVFRDRTINYAPDPGRYTPDQGYLYINQEFEPMSDASASEIRVTQFIPKFKKEKKLVFVLPIVMSIGGVERNAVEIMSQLKDRYHFVVITMDRHDNSKGSLHHQLKGVTEAVYDLMELGHLHYYLAFLNDLKEAYEPDAVWICNGMLWLCDHAEHVRRIFHDVPIIDNQAWNPEFGWIELYDQPGIQSFDRFIATNSEVYRKFVDDFKMNPQRIDSIYPCFDSERFRAPSPVDEQRAFIREFDLPEDRPVFLFCGRLTNKKAPLDFVELARRRLQRQDDAFFVMRGTGELAPEIDQLIHDNGLTNLRRISFLENTVPLLSIASGLIMTSHHESMGIVVVEALSMGLPVLATDAGDIRLVLEQWPAGLLVSEIGDMDAFEAAYEKWRKDLPLYAAKARQCSEQIRLQFSAKAIAQQYVASWETAMKEFSESRMLIVNP